MDVSVIICTYNRCESLIRTVQSIVDMRVPEGFRWELVIVDNNSSDGTKKAVAEFISLHDAEIRCVTEQNKGLSNARNKGMEESRGDIIVFTDDDCLVGGDWLTSLVHEFRSDGIVSGVGGRVELYDSRDKPVTIKTSKERGLFSSVGQLFSFMHGCNMAFDRSILEKVGRFDSRLGAGTRIASAEDTDFIYRVHRNGHKIIYSPDVVVYHNHGRRSDLEVEKLMYGYMVGRGAFYLKHILKRDLIVLKMAYWDISAMMKSVMNKSTEKKLRQKTIDYLKNIALGACYYLLDMLKPAEYKR